MPATVNTITVTVKRKTSDKRITPGRYEADIFRTFVWLTRQNRQHTFGSMSRSEFFEALESGAIVPDVGITIQKELGK